MFGNGWLRKENILAYPHGWQYPARTEEWVYEQCIERFVESKYSELVCFPWATLIDMERRRVSRSRTMLDALQAAPPKKRLVRATVCQHIYAEDMLPWFQALKITDLYWSHATTTALDFDGIRIHPFPLYPVCSYDYQITENQFSNRRYLYSFVGAYNPELYLTPVREWLFDLPERQDALIISRKEWHFEQLVYTEQISRRKLDDLFVVQNEKEAQEYRMVLEESKFSLCPSGSGPNSIRLWESLGFGCIPVIMSDTLRLPGDGSLWEQAVVKIPESKQSIDSLPEILSALAKDEKRLEVMRAAGRVLWDKYGVNGPVTILNDLNRAQYVRELVGMS